jgi:hypothetical protein
MAMANIGAVERLREIRVRPKYGRWIVSERGKMTRVADTIKITKVMIENMKVGEALGS